MHQSMFNSQTRKFTVIEMFTIKVAEEIDAVEIYNFKKVHFDTSEPVRVSHVNIICGHRDIKHLLRHVKNKNVLIAVESSSNNLVGFSICEMVDEKVKSEGIETEDQALQDLISFFAFVEEKSKIHQRFGVEEHFKILVVSVHRDYARQGIATKLFKASLDLGKSKNSKLISVDCSSKYTAKIAENMGMELITTVTYDEVNNHLGKQLFIPKPPHNDVKTFVKILS